MIRIISTVFLIFISLATMPAHAYETRATTPGAFDYYLLNMSWAPEFCHAKRNTHSQECQTDGLGVVLHGLWPQFADGYPEHCSNARGPTNVSALLDIMPTTELVQHEWSTHGTCSGLKADDYFAAMRKAYSSIRIPEQLTSPSRGFFITPSNLRQLFIDANPGLRSENMAISCGNNYLTAIEICLNKDTLKPVRCGQLRDCHANTIRITPVKSSNFYSK